MSSSPHTLHNVQVLIDGIQHAPLKHLLTKIRSCTTDSKTFVRYAKRLHRILAEAGINALPTRRVEIKTVMNQSYIGEVIDEDSVALVSIIRAGDALLEAARESLPQAPVGKILIQRDHDTSEANHYYHKLPSKIADMHVLLLDPMCGTGGTAKKACDILIEHGVRQEYIVYVNVISCPEGISHLLEHYPRIHIVTCEIDSGLDSRKYILPGIGDYGDRWFSTEVDRIPSPRKQSQSVPPLVPPSTRHPWAEELLG